MKLGEFIPDNEKWLHAPEAKAKLDRALEWAALNPSRETDLAEFEALVRKKQKVKAVAPKQKRAA